MFRSLVLIFNLAFGFSAHAYQLDITDVSHEMVAKRISAINVKALEVVFVTKSQTDCNSLSFEVFPTYVEDYFAKQDSTDDVYFVTGLLSTTQIACGDQTLTKVDVKSQPWTVNAAGNGQISIIVLLGAGMDVEVKEIK